MDHYPLHPRAVGAVKAKEAPKEYDYGDRYSIKNVHARKNSDGTVQPATTPTKLAEMTYSTLKKDDVEEEIICYDNDEEGVSMLTTKPDDVTTAAASSSVAASSSSSPSPKKKWRCDVCHVKLFDDYNTAIKHEQTCKSWLKSGVAAMPLTAGEKEILDDLATMAGMTTTKPPRPHTEYTLFYQLEREFIIHRELATDDERNDGTNDDKDDHSSSSPGSDDSNGNQEVALLFENDPHMPARYRSLPLRADWYISGKSKGKRKHCKSHGKIGFIELTRMIAARWAKVDDETKKYCKMMAAAELVKYKEELECYNQYKKRLSTIGEIPEDMKERMIKKQRKKEKKRGTTYTGPNDYVVI